MITLWAVHAENKSWLGGHFSELGFAGFGARKPRREIEGSALEPFFHVVLRLNELALIVSLKYHIKASVTLMAFGRGKSNHTLARCVFFYPHCFTKIIEAYCCDEKHD